jgi:hypothetical protein
MSKCNNFKSSIMYKFGSRPIVASVQNDIQFEINPFGGRCVISVIETTGARNFSLGNLSTRIIRVP